MPEVPYRLQNSTALTWTIGGTEYPVAGVSEATVTLSQSIVELFTGDSVKREDKYQEQVQPEAEVTVRKWDHEIINTVLGTPGTGTALEDTAVVPDVILEGTFQASGSDREITIKLSGGSTEEWPIFDLSLGDYGEWSLSLTFDDIETFTVTDPV